MSAETIALLAFRNRDGSLGFAQSRDPLTYGIRIERGESQTRWVSGGATLEWMALVPGREKALGARDQLNEMGPEEAEAEIRRLALPGEVVEMARVLIWAHVWEDGGEAADEHDREKLSEAIAKSLSAGASAEAGGAGRGGGGEALECRWPQRLLIFDLDGTLADTSAFDGAGRRSHGGELAKIKLYGGPAALGMHDLARIAAPERTVMVVTSSPREYARDVLGHIGVKVDEIYQAGTDKRPAMREAMLDAACGPDGTLVIGDRWPDWRAARALGIRSVGARSFGAKLPTEAPDAAFSSVNELLSAEDPAALSYIGEAELPREQVRHEGSVLKIEASSWALGRYFNKRTREELGFRDRLTTDILDAKGGVMPARLAEAVGAVLERMAASGRMDIGAVISMPAKPGQVDRFKQPREMALRALGLGGGVRGGVEDLFPGRGGQKDKNFEQRQEAQENRYRWEGEPLEGRAVLLLDDVWTSGASAKAAGSALRQAGAREVYTLVWGVTQKWW